MTKPRKPSVYWKQWNVRLDPELSTALRAHLENPLLVGLPNGKLMEFFTIAVKAELTKRGAWPPVKHDDSFLEGEKK